VIRGVKSLHGADLTAHDLRGGAALVLAGLRAEGMTRIEGAQRIDRGYVRLEEALSALGGRVTREPPEANV
jgi:UDP-N-acetylglucosamine 1-carboxyvinyltransferase